jgi:uncharacterized membrane protein YfcA
MAPLFLLHLIAYPRVLHARHASPTLPGAVRLCDAASMALDLITYVAAVFFFAGTIKGTIAVGLPTIAMGLLSLFMAPAQAAPLIVLPTLITNLWQMGRGPDLAALLRRLWPMLVCTVIATVTAAHVITQANGRLAAAMLGAVLMTYAALALSGVRFAVSAAAEPVLGPLVGLVTGVINGTTAVSVIPAIPYVQAIKLGKDELVQAIAMSAFVSAAALGLGLGSTTGVDPALAAPGLAAIVAALAGMALGQAVRSRLSAEAFRRAVLIGLFALGAIMTARALA